MAQEAELRTHAEWIGFLQPVGLVVSPPALIAAGAYVDRNVGPVQRRLASLVEERPGLGPAIADLPRFCFEVLGWEERDLAGHDGAPLPDELSVALPEYGDVLSPTYAVADGDAWLLLVQAVPEGTDLDAVPRDDRDGWRASPQARFDRLLRTTEIPIGLLSNGTSLRLVYAPRGESTGHATFCIRDMLEVAGRPILGAFHMLLSAERLFVLADEERLPHILAESRKYQTEVSKALGEQVIRALWELMRGFEAADEKRRGQLLGYVRRNDPEHLYGGLLATILRLVFVLYAEDNGLMPADPVYHQHYSVTGLFARLRDEAGRFPDHMDHRYGAWPQLLTLFRLLFDGARHGQLRLPMRRGELFDPDTYPFLEGRAYGKRRVMGDKIRPPRVSDGAVFRVLRDLLILNGERLSYRALDVEQIGSVYEGMMGFTVEVAHGPSIAVGKDHVVVNLEKLLERSPADRIRALNDDAGVTLSGKAVKAFKEAQDVDAMVAALDRRISKRTPQVIPPEGLYLQPTQERRRSGSHYTPRTLTEPIVRTTLRPVLVELGEHPTPEQILDLKVCDPAMGSGAFLVEACRQLGDVLVEAWQCHKQEPELPPDEDLVLHARRLVAQRCLYGVDKNHFAVSLAKLSLWLVTLAKDHPFTFVDHALRVGDSLVGLSREQILAFDWEVGQQIPTIKAYVDPAVQEAEEKRRRIQELGDLPDNAEKRRLLRESDVALGDVRLIGDLAIAAFFGEGTAKGRKERRSEYEAKLSLWRAGKLDRKELAAAVEELRAGDFPVPVFHWEIEFPEVFRTDRGGFDAICGNPPFAGKNTIASSTAPGFLDWLKASHEETHGNADLVAHFFRRAFNLIRPKGTFGLIATNTIGQGDTRHTGLRWLGTHGGTIYNATKRLKWPGASAVVVSVVHVQKGESVVPPQLDGRDAKTITSFLFHSGGHDDPAALQQNAGKSFIGSYVLGMGFTFDDTATSAVASPISAIRRLTEADPRNAERIFPYIGGQEVNTHPAQRHHRYVINFAEMSEGEARQWPDLMKIVEENVKPDRMKQNREVRKKYWWRFGETTPSLFSAINGLDRVLAVARVSQSCAFVFLPAGMVYSEQLVIFPFTAFAAFSVLQSRTHEIWARFFGSSMKDDLRYTPSDCFETFPFPEHWETHAKLEAIGKEYYDYRANLMVQNNEGLTATYNRFHDPEETDLAILRLRELHGDMDRAVLDAYGSTNIRPSCAFLLDYEVEEDEPGKRGKKKPWRYRWPDEIRDEVLGRLLELNAERAAEERLLGEQAELKAGKRKPAAKTEPAAGAGNLPLFGDDE